MVTVRSIFTMISNFYNHSVIFSPLCASSAALLFPVNAAIYFLLSNLTFPIPWQGHFVISTLIFYMKENHTSFWIKER